ncbi:type II toxin-antitoxin system RelB/DinJ family antitoxin [Alysiella filiformis]|uniref:Addiction module antitoxin, RelB/DinJ family n=1 Tax=Alysiella filiformis DSM 16848 TaxID=1120981 RepID=A0A286E379_9NEIS|nr:type II toxin-antitoxin system RelB/DinJ family antitoxin [Alysiella filiformis]QMT31134.1 type II toxin-antitoxin system RelB/DinJ family antitoxin [Alysiella filiformis]UBQ55874.1 type II toxin-antitoxin system RelB/DinJ family antitoxin [Alysiella filiformis DSM 16848]SOD65334.1 addiction module antitoxin, RelB/DinJ family [Alysiella filiformis DSM 16848]
MSYSHIHFLADENIKKQAFDVIKSHGLTPAKMFNLLLAEIARTRVLPVNVNPHSYATTQNTLAEKLACDDGLDIEFERIDLGLREVAIKTSY